MITKDEILKEIYKLTLEHDRACEELKDLIKKDYQIPVKKERFFFISSRIKRVFDKIIEAEIKLNELQYDEIKIRNILK